MLRYTVRSVLAHKARLLLTAAAIVLGVAMVAGTFILLDTAEAGGRDLAQGRHRVDVTVRAVPSEEEVFSDETGEFVPGPPMPLSTVERAARIAGVASAVGVTVGDARLIARDGHVDGGRAPLGRSIDASFVPDLRAGRVPGRAGEIVVDRATADDEGIGVGDRVRILVSGGEPRDVAVVGVLDSPEFTDEVALVGFDPATARRLLGPSGTVGFIEVHAAPGIGERRLRDGVASALGGGHQAFTGAALASERTRPDDLIRQILLVASAVALFTGAFLIRNTFSITLAARTRELALLRCVGAGRGQLRRSILLEAAIVGAVAAALGLVAGVGVAWVLGGLLHAGGAIVTDVSGAAPRILPRTVATAMAVGVIAAAASAWGPARRATRVPPVAALRADVFTLDRRASRIRTAVGAVATAGGVAAVLAGVSSDPARSSFLQAGAIATALGVLILGPVLARTLSHVIGAPAGRARGIVGELARGNAARNPVRTAATLLPLTIGLALTGFLVTLAAGTEASSLDDFDRTIHADLHVAAAGLGPHRPRMSPAALDRLAAVPELDAVSPFRSTEATVAGREGTVTGADPALAGRMLAPKVTGTPLSDLGPGGMAVSREAADDRHLAVGSPVTVRTARGERAYTVRTIFDAPRGYFALPYGDYFLTSSDYANLTEDRGVTEIYATARDGVGQDAARAAAAQALAAHPGVEVTDRGEMRREVAAELDPALRVYYSLLGLVIVIALFGVANTLSLSILERVRELGLLRAVGMDRRQVRSLIRWEAIIIAGIAAVTGPVLGAFLGWATTVALGLPETAVPVANLALFTAVAIAMTAVAAALPARRAARIPMLRALSAD
ncbi:FtsX-like permease family protein [Actinomadura welshii]|uniref:FtsX-like permease family protein n=1 Tax=Actinomadura welshii TaxID=3103817 RepID=UPI0003AD2C61|nr:FtsX-like permease family protein [Actinomadura madurae]